MIEKMVRILFTLRSLRYFNSRISKTRLYSSNYDAEVIEVSRIRNFSIVAHVDHGKSTLADRLLELTGVIKPGNETSQVLDQLQVERERGITVKAVTASLNYKYNNEDYLLNLIDTPGHVDFSNEVVRSVKACQGVIFLVDANEGVQAQTVAVHSLAKRNNLVIIPTLNKVDLPRADPENTKSQLKSLFNIDPDTVLSISAKKGWGVKELLEAVILRIPPPNVDLNKPFKATIIDTWHDKYRGVMCLAYIESGSIEVGQTVKWRSDLKQHTLKYLALLRPTEESVVKAVAGQVVMVGCGPKGGGSVGDELLSLESAETTKVASAPTVKHMVYAGIFPADQSQHTQLSDAIKKLALNDSAVSVSVDSSPALGQGWRIGFLGLLHLDVFTQRLLQEHKAEAILTAPSVPYKIKVKGAKAIKQYKGEEVIITNPLQLPNPNNIVEYYEPFVIGTIITPVEYIGAVNTLCVDRRGTPLPSSAVDERMTMMQFILPLSEVVIDFHDTLKSLTSGFASFDYQDYGFHPSSLVRMDILINGVLVDELTTIVHSSRLEYNARRLTTKLKEMIPRQMVQVAIQAVVNGKVYSRETLKAYRKDVTAKLVTTTDDPVIRRLSKTTGTVYATDAILATIMCCTRSNYSWDIVIEKIGDKLFLDKRDNTEFDLLTVNETSVEPPADDGNSINSPRNLAFEATFINHNFSQQVLRTGPNEPKYKFPEPNPFVSEEEGEVASVGYRYRKWNLNNGVVLVARCEHDAVLQGPQNETQFLTIKALNEWDSKVANGVEWRQKLDTQRGAVLANELRNNSCKLAKWTVQALLAGSDQIKFGYVSRTQVRDNSRHVILGTQQFKPHEFAAQINLSMDNACKYLIMKDPNKPLIRLYDIPDNTFESDGSEESGDEPADTPFAPLYSYGNSKRV